MRRLGELVIRRRALVLIVAILLLPIAGVFGGPVEQHLSSGGFDDPGAEAVHASDALEATFGTGTPNLLLLVTVNGATGTVDDPAVADAGRALTEQLAAEPGVDDVVSYWSLGGAAPLRTENGRRALVLGRIAGDEDEVRERAEVVTPRFESRTDLVTVQVGGEGEVLRTITEQAKKDLEGAERLTLPLVLLLLLVVFGSAVAAGLPLGVGAFAVVGTYAVLRIIGDLTQVSVFALNLTTAMGLGLAIDYSLFVVSRYREELANGYEPHRSVLRTMQTAGRTVVFSALTVAVSLAALLVFPLPYLRSFAYAGVAVVALAAVGAVVVLPALLAVIGTRIDKGRLFHRREVAATEGFWFRRSHAVMRRPWPYAIGVVAVLVGLGLPFLGVKLGTPDDRVLPAGIDVRDLHDVLRTEFASRESSAVTIVAAEAGGVSDADVGAYAEALSALPGVARVDARTGFYAGGALALGPTDLSQRFVAPGATWLSVVPSVEPLSPEGESLVHAVRDTPAPFDVEVGGPTASFVDGKDSMLARLPLAIAIIAVATFVLLFLMVGSLLVPLKALVLNVLSLSATFGALVWVFQDGNGAGLLNFTATGTIDTNTPLLLFCVAFGLSMDYEVFLLSRIKEEYDAGHGNEESVATGLERTGRIVTAAAILLAVVFIAFATAQVTLVKLFGIGLTLAVLVDAFLIRATLVPAFMRLAGRANWWAPRWLRRIHLQFGIWEAEPLRILDLTDDALRRQQASADDIETHA